MKIDFNDLSSPLKATVIVPCFDNLEFPKESAALDAKVNGILTATAKRNDFKGKEGKTLTIQGITHPDFATVILLGLGKKEDLTALKLQNAGGHALAALDRALTSDATLIADCADTVDGGAAWMGYGAALRNYRFEKYRTRDADKQKTSVASLQILTSDAAKAKTTFKDLELIANAVNTTRNLVTEPPNVIYPESLAQRAKELEAFGVKLEVLDEKEMAKLGMGALLGVGQGSAQKPRLIIMQWMGAKDKNQKPVAFIGKGVTFDSGGLNLKVNAGIEDMKMDMAGAATIIGTMQALASRKAKVNAVGIIGAVENMPSSTAQRPSDVVKTMSGQTVEILNTDAEGRLVLSDALWYCQNRFSPKVMIDFATLTGAIIIALGDETAGLFTNDDALSQQLLDASKSSGERLWRMPLDSVYDSHIKSDIADMKNTGKGRTAGSISAAKFLEQFTNNVPWAHIDIAGTAWTKSDEAVTPKGATGYGVRLMDAFVRASYEERE